MYKIFEWSRESGGKGNGLKAASLDELHTLRIKDLKSYKFYSKNQSLTVFFYVH